MLVYLLKALLRRLVHKVFQRYGVAPAMQLYAFHNAVAQLFLLVDVALGNTVAALGNSVHQAVIIVVHDVIAAFIISVHSLQDGLPVLLVLLLLDNRRPLVSGLPHGSKAAAVAAVGHSVAYALYCRADGIKIDVPALVSLYLHSSLSSVKNNYSSSRKYFY